MNDSLGVLLEAIELDKKVHEDYLDAINAEKINELHVAWFKSVDNGEFSKLIPVDVMKAISADTEEKE